MKPLYNIEKKELYQKYKVEKLSIIECSKYFGCSESPIQRFLKKYNIPYNTKSEMMKGSNAPWFGKNGKDHPNYKKVERKCAWCQKKVYRMKSYNKIENTFCSKICRSSWSRKNLTGLNNPSFTSIKVKCSWCGKEIIRTKSLVSKNKHFFCCRKHCGLWKAENMRGDKIYNWKGGYLPYYGENWLSQRRLALKRDDYTCQECGKTRDDLGKNPDVHHKKSFREFGLENYLQANNLKNLVCLCGKCHSKITNKN